MCQIVCVCCMRGEAAGCEDVCQVDMKPRELRAE